MSARVLAFGVAATLALSAGSAAAAAKKKKELSPAEQRRARLMQAGASEPPPEDGPVRLVLQKVIDVDRWPKAVELTPDGAWAMTTNFSDNTLSLIDTKTLEKVKTLKTGASSPVEVDYFADGRHALVTGGWQKSDLMVVDLVDWKIVKSLPGKKDGKTAERRIFPKIVTFSPDRSRFYVSYWESDNVGVFDAKTYALLGLVPAGRNPRGIAITPDGKKGYVANFDTKGNSVTVFQADAAPFPVLKTIAPLPNPRHVEVSPDGRFAYVSLFGATGGVAKIDTATDEVVARSTGTGKRGKTVKVSPDGRWLYLVNFAADTLSVLDAATLAEVARVETGDEPCGLDISKDGRTLWSTDWNDDKVRVWQVVEKPAGGVVQIEDAAPHDRP